MPSKVRNRSKRQCPECDALILASNLSRHMKTMHGAGAPASEPPDDGPADSTGDDSPYVEERVPGSTEKPKATKRWPWQRDRPVKAKVVKKRVSTAGLAEMLWGETGRGLIRHDPPVGRVLVMQAPFVGDIVDEAVKGTIADKLLQPIARTYETAEGLSAIVGVPLLVGMLERHPERAPVLMPMLRASIAPMLVQMAKGALKAEKRRQETVEAMESVAEFLPPELMALVREGGLSPEDALIDLIFGPPEPEPEQEEARAAS